MDLENKLLRLIQKTANNSQNLEAAVEQRELQTRLREMVQIFNPKKDEAIMEKLLEKYSTLQQLKDLFKAPNYERTIAEQVESIAQTLAEPPVPVLNYSDEQRALPIFEFKDQIVQTVRNNPVTILSGETGCGKSTQVPQYLFEAEFYPMGCTQPRRIAAITLKHRVQSEMRVEGNGVVDYQVRYDKTRTPFTKILFATEGILLRHLTVDPLLKKYSVLVLDEVHERRLFTDFMLGLVKILLRKRKDLRVLLMSATINDKLFQNYFPNAPLIKVPGRQHDVTTIYRPLAGNRAPGDGDVQFDAAPYLNIMHEIDTSMRAGDVLIFLHGVAAIEDVVNACTSYATRASKKWLVLPLHGSLELQEQQEVFKPTPKGYRKCVVTTNIAETSITINGIGFVVDSGEANVKYWDSRLRMYSLRRTMISKANADQRRGRAGRTMVGTCYRMYDQYHYNVMDEFEQPEIMRTLPDGLLLQMLAVGIVIKCTPKPSRSMPLPSASGYGSGIYAVSQQPPVQSKPRTSLYSIKSEFEFLQAPDPREMEEALAYLIDYAAVKVAPGGGGGGGGAGRDGEAVLTSLGRLLARIPVEMQSAKMLLFGAMFQGCTEGIRDTCLVAAGLMACSRPFLQRGAFVDQNQTVARNLRSVVAEDGDFLSIMKMYDGWTSVKANENHLAPFDGDDEQSKAMERFFSSGRKEVAESKSKPWCNERFIAEKVMYDICRARREYNKIINSTHCFDQFVRERLANDPQNTHINRAIKDKLRRILNNMKHRRAITMTQRSGGDGDRMNNAEMARSMFVNNPPELAALLASQLNVASREAQEDNAAQDNIIISSVGDNVWSEYRESDLDFHLRKLENVRAAFQPPKNERELLHLSIAMALYPNIAISSPGNANTPNLKDLQYETIRHGTVRIDNRSLLYHHSGAMKPTAEFCRSADDATWKFMNISDNNFVIYYKDAYEPPKPKNARPDKRIQFENRTYLRTCGRALAVQSLLMCCNEIDIGLTCRRLIFDRWFQVIIDDVVPPPTEAALNTNATDRASADKRIAQFLSRAIRVRKLFNVGLDLLNGLIDSNADVEPSSVSKFERMSLSEKLENVVKTELCELLQHKVMAAIEKVQVQYTTADYAVNGPSSSHATGKYVNHPALHSNKNGLVVDAVFTFDSILPVRFEAVAQNYAGPTPHAYRMDVPCVFCKKICMTAFELFRHSGVCSGGLDGIKLPKLLDDTKPYRTTSGKYLRSDDNNDRYNKIAVVQNYD